MLKVAGSHARTSRRCFLGGGSSLPLKNPSVDKKLTVRTLVRTDGVSHMSFSIA